MSLCDDFFLSYFRFLFIGFVQPSSCSSVAHAIILLTMVNYKTIVRYWHKLEFLCMLRGFPENSITCNYEGII